MFEVLETQEYAKWIDRLRDKRAQIKIILCIERLASGNPGDSKALGSGVSELRIDYGPGYRIYYMEMNRAIIILLAGGDKGTQTRDIAKARMLAEQIKSEGI